MIMRTKIQFRSYLSISDYRSKYINLNMYFIHYPNYYTCLFNLFLTFDFLPSITTIPTTIHTTTPTVTLYNFHSSEYFDYYQYY